MSTNLERERELINRLIWCDLHRTYQRLSECKFCQYNDNCEYRDKGAMKRVRVNFNNWLIKKKKEVKDA